MLKLNDKSKKRECDIYNLIVKKNTAVIIKESTIHEILIALLCKVKFN